MRRNASLVAAQIWLLRGARFGLEEAVDCGQEVVGEEGFEAEVDVEAGVGIFGFFEAADDEDGEVGLELAELGDELGTVHAGHDVVGEDEVDGCGEFVVAELFEGALGAENGDNVIAGAFEDGLAGGRLNGIVVNEENGGRHRFLSGWLVQVEAGFTGEHDRDHCNSVFMRNKFDARHSEKAAFGNLKAKDCYAVGCKM